MTLGERIRHGTKWLVLGGLSSQVLQFAFGVVLARLLLPEDFGLLVTVQIFTGFVGMIASAGMGEATVQAKEVSERDYETLFAVQLAIGVVIYAGFFLIAPWFARWFGHPIYEPLLRVSALSFLIRPFSANPGVRLRRAMRFKETAVIGFMSMIFTGVLSIFWAWQGWGVWSLVLSGLAGAVLSALLLSWRAPWRPIPRYHPQSARRLGAYGAKNVLNELLVYFRAQTPNFLITKTLGPAAVGLYNKADSLSDMPLRLLGGSTYQTVFRAMSQVQDDVNQSRYLYVRTLTLLAFYTFPAFLALGFAAEPFVVALYGEKWQAAAWPLALFCLAGPFRLLEIVSGALIAAQNRLGRESILQGQAWMLLTVACLVVASYGIHVIAIAVLAVAVVHGLRMCALALSTIGSSWQAVWQALAAVLRLCAVEACVLLAVSQLTRELGLTSPFLQLPLIAGTGLAAYAMLALLKPPAPLRSEANRWRKLVGLSPLPA
ncbi:lipopolysaccharide biosynthesis protein [Thiobacter aerophilum]|uniref:Lipopolysaccharide biosynthesis protein n=1 Tax=Thiobacter aerophilum TaxID=3121275 RepID=A0ABV0EG47_9BURK